MRKVDDVDLDNPLSNVPTTRPLSNEDATQGNHSSGPHILLTQKTSESKNKTDCTLDKSPKGESTNGMIPGVYTMGIHNKSFRSETLLSKNIDIELEMNPDLKTSQEKSGKIELLPDRKRRNQIKQMTSFESPRHIKKKEVSPSVHKRVSVLRDSPLIPSSMNKKTPVFFAKPLSGEACQLESQGNFYTELRPQTQPCSKKAFAFFPR